MHLGGDDVEIPVAVQIGHLQAMCAVQSDGGDGVLCPFAAPRIGRRSEPGQIPLALGGRQRHIQTAVAVQVGHRHSCRRGPVGVEDVFRPGIGADVRRCLQPAAAKDHVQIAVAIQVGQGRPLAVAGQQSPLAPLQRSDLLP